MLAGGQSLIPLMKLRFASPRALVDINRIEGLDSIQEEDGFLSIGALVRHTDCERSDALRGRFGVLGDAAPQISDPIVRNRGTVVGSLAHADPQGDWGSALSPRAPSSRSSPRAGRARSRSTSSSRARSRRASSRTRSPRPCRCPTRARARAGTYLKLERKVGDYATVGVAVHLSFDNGTVGRAGIALTGVGPGNLRAETAEEALAGAELNDDTIKAAAELAAEAAQPRSDERGSADYKRSVVRVFTERGLRKAAETAAA